MKVTPLNDLPLIQEIGALAAARGFEIYVVGGCVRDWVMGQPSLDLDFLVSGDSGLLAKDLAERVGGTYTCFDKFLTTRIFLEGGRRVDIARFRKESYQKPAALPTVVVAASVQEDLKRRDFASNAMALAVSPGHIGEVVDPYGGLADVKAGIVRALHEKSFIDDPTRIYRAARFAGRFGWKIATETAALIRDSVAGRFPALLSRERLRAELFKLLEEKDPTRAFLMLKEMGAAEFFHPDFIWPAAAVPCAGIEARMAAVYTVMGSAGPEFLASLKLSKKMSTAIQKTAQTLKR